MREDTFSQIPAVVLPKVMRVLEILRTGDKNATLWKACQEVGISRGALLNHVRQHPELQVEFDKAIEDADDTLAEILVDIDQIHSDAKMAAVVSKNIQWLLARRRPAKFGDRITVTNEGGSADKVIVEALRAAIDRIPLPPSHADGGKLLELTAVNEDEELAALQ
jgi:hypothetical protein